MANVRELKEQEEKKGDAVQSSSNHVQSANNAFAAFIKLISEIPNLKSKNVTNIYAQLEEQEAIVQLKLITGFIRKGFVSDIAIDAIQRFLAKRHTRLLYTYNETPHQPLTQACFLLATAVAEITKKNRFQVLMPELVSPESFIGISLSDPQTQLQQFVLSDDSHYFIDVLACLDSAVEDGVLKHTQKLNNGKPVPLSDAEIKRVSEHSKESKKYYDAILQLHGFLKYGKTHGSEIKKLADKLWAGGRTEQEKMLQAEAKKQQASQQQPAPLPIVQHEVEIGPVAVQGIENFHSYLASLAESERERLLACSTGDDENLQAGNSPTLKVLWARIFSHYYLHVKERKIEISEKTLEEYYRLLEAYPEHSVPCIELYSNDLKCVITANPHLLYGLAQFKQKCENLSDLLRRVISQPQSKVKLKLIEASPQLWEAFISQSTTISEDFSPLEVTTLDLTQLFENIPQALIPKLISFLKKRITCTSCRFSDLQKLQFTDENIREILSSIIERSVFEAINHSDHLPLDPIWAAAIFAHLIAIDARCLNSKLFIDFFSNFAKENNIQNLQIFLDRLNKAWTLEQFKINYSLKGSSVLSSLDSEKVSLVVNFFGLTNSKFLINNDLVAFSKVVSLVISEKLPILKTLPFFRDFLHNYLGAANSQAEIEIISTILLNSGNDLSEVLNILGKEFLLDQAILFYHHLISKLTNAQILLFNAFIGWGVLNREYDKEQKEQKHQKPAENFLVFYEKWRDENFTTIFNSLSLKHKFAVIRSIYFKSQTHDHSLARLLCRAAAKNQLLEYIELLLCEHSWSEFIKKPKAWIRRIVSELPPDILEIFLKQLPPKIINEIRKYIITNNDSFCVTIKNLPSFYALFEFLNLRFLNFYFNKLTQHLHKAHPDSFELIKWTSLINEDGFATQLPKELSFEELGKLCQAHKKELITFFVKVYTNIEIAELDIFLNTSFDKDSDLYRTIDIITSILLAIQDYPTHLEAYCKKIIKENNNYQDDLDFVKILSSPLSTESFQVSILSLLLPEEIIALQIKSERFKILQALAPNNRARYLILWPKNSVNNLTPDEINFIVALMPIESREVIAIFLKGPFLKHISHFVAEEKSTDALVMFFATPDVVTTEDLGFLVENFEQPTTVSFLSKFLSRFHELFPHILNLIGKDLLAKYALRAAREIVIFKDLDVEQRAIIFKFLGWEDCETIEDIFVPENAANPHWLNSLSYREFKVIFNSLNQGNREYFFSQVNAGYLFAKMVKTLKDEEFPAFFAEAWGLFKAKLQFKLNFIDWNESSYLLTHIDDRVVDNVYNRNEVKELIKHDNLLLNLPHVISTATNKVRKKIFEILNLSWIEEVYGKMPRQLDWYSFLGPLPKSPDFFASFSPEFLLRAFATLPIGLDNENSQANFLIRLFSASDTDTEFCLSVINLITPQHFAFIFISAYSINKALAALSKSEVAFNAFLLKIAPHLLTEIRDEDDEEDEDFLDFIRLLSEEQQLAWLPKYPRSVRSWLCGDNSGTFLQALHPKAQLLCLTIWNYNLGRDTSKFFNKNLKYFSEQDKVLTNFKATNNGAYLQFLKNDYSFYLWYGVDLATLECFKIVAKILPNDLELLHPSSFRDAIFIYALSRNEWFNKEGLLLSVFEAIPASFLATNLLLKDSFSHALSELDVALATWYKKFKSFNYFAVLFALVKIYIFNVNKEENPRYSIFNWAYSKQERLAAAEAFLEILKDPSKDINELHEKVLLGSSTLKDIYKKYVEHKRAWYRPPIPQLQAAAGAEEKEEKYVGERPKRP